MNKEQVAERTLDGLMQQMTQVIQMCKTILQTIEQQQNRTATRAMADNRASLQADGFFFNIILSLESTRQDQLHGIGARHALFQ